MCIRCKQIGAYHSSNKYCRMWNGLYLSFLSFTVGDHLIEIIEIPETDKEQKKILNRLFAYLFGVS